MSRLSAIFRSFPWLSPSILAIAYWLAAQFSISFATLPQIASTPVWIGAGVAVGGILVGRSGVVWGIFASVLVLEYQYFQGWTGVGLVLTILVTIVVTLGKWGAARLIQWLSPRRSFLERPGDVVRFVVWGAFLSHLPVGLLCAACICGLGRAPWSSYSTIAVTWWLSDAFGILLITPLIVAWSQLTRSTRFLFRRRWLELVGLGLGVTLNSLLAFKSHYPLEYMLMPLILWAAFRFRQAGATLLMVIGGLVALVGTAQGYGSFVRDSLNESLLLLQSFIGVIGLTTLLVGAVLHQNETAEQQLRKANATLEERVQQRTAQLAEANAAIQRLNARLKAENLNIAAQLDLVRQIQDRILPKPQELESLQGLDVAGYMAAAEDVGGDYYDVLATEAGVTVAMGDVTGHGLESGLIMLMTQTAVRTLTELSEISPSLLLSTLNRTLYKNIQRLNTYKNLTFVLVHYDRGQISITGQHEEVIIVRANGTVEPVETIDLGFPLGLEPEIGEFVQTHTLTLAPQDGFVLFSDGIVEAMNSQKQLYGFDRLCAQLQQHWGQSATEIQGAIVADVQAHLGPEKPLDDMSLLILKRLT